MGAGFGGMWTTRGLANRSVDVTLVDRNNYHTFFPLLYQVAAAELGPTDIAHPVRSIFRRARNVTVRWPLKHRRAKFAVRAQNRVGVSTWRASPAVRLR